jgi:hypothetical protein
LPQRLQHDAVALREPEHRIELILRRVRVELELEADVLEADRRLLLDAERAAKVEIAFGQVPPVAGCSPATASARPVSTLQAIVAESSEPCALSVTTAAFGSER